ncbi:phage tail protein [Bradyrhizobium genosp. A]|uniref:phage tail protein n=1 Tax=Bradyrhizobium genosp. A TaxID=83626 RepID=UPI003CF60D9B
MTLYRWSQVAATDATADPTINWAEGMSPAVVNDSARAMMAATAKYRDDIAGAIVTGGTSTAYTVSSNQQFDSLVNLNGKMIAFTPHVTNGATVTLNVDGLGAKPLRPAPAVELQGGVLIQGTPYAAVYSNADGVFYLFGVGTAPGIPLAAGMDYWATTTPSSSFAFATGQAISRTTYAALFALIGTTYGGGDGSTTFNLPDKRGRVSAGFDNGDITGRLNGAFGVNAAALGSAGGEQGHTLTAAEIPAITSTASPTLAVATTLNNYVASNSGDNTLVSAGGSGGVAAVSLNGGPTVSKLGATGTATGTVSSASNNTGGAAHNNIQPTIVCNYIMRII